MLNPNEKSVLEFVQEFAPQVPVSRRINIYLGLCDMIDSREIKDVLQAKAAIWEEAEKRCRELNFNFTKGGAR